MKTTLKDLHSSHLQALFSLIFSLFCFLLLDQHGRSGSAGLYHSTKSQAKDVGVPL